MPARGHAVTLTQLAYAVAVDTHRHFERAAAACGVTQPTLSMQLRKLEGALGTALFDRRRVPVVPTTAGAALLAQARVVLREAARLDDLRVLASGTIAGELRLGVIPTLAPYLLPRLLDTLATRHPQLQLIVEERVTAELIAELRADALDAALIATRTDDAVLVSRTLFREPFVGYAGARHRLAGSARLTADDLSLGDLWILSEGHCLRTQVVTLCGQRTPARDGRRELGGDAGPLARIESGNLDSLARLVERGTGMTLLPALAAAALPTAAQRRLAIPFADPAPTRGIRMVRRRRGPRQHLVRLVAATTREVAREMLGIV
jgi:LysR family hydrogen peroxide-inducible transcriptional activator